MITKFLTDLITDNIYPGHPSFKSKEELIDYFGEDIGIDYKDTSKIKDYIFDWEEKHNFTFKERNLIDYDLEASYVVYEVVYSLDNKYYKTAYYYSPYDSSDLLYEPYEVEPVEIPTIIIHYVKHK